MFLVRELLADLTLSLNELCFFVRRHRYRTRVFHEALLQPHHGLRWLSIRAGDGRSEVIPRPVRQLQTVQPLPVFMSSVSRAWRAGGEGRVAVSLTQVGQKAFFTDHMLLGFWKLLGRCVRPGARDPGKSPGWLWPSLRSTHYSGGLIWKRSRKSKYRGENATVLLLPAPWDYLPLV